MHALARLLPRRGFGALLLAGAAALLATGAAHAQSTAGEISHLQGMATAQQPGGEHRFLGQGDAVLEGDTLNTTERGFAVVTLRDGSKFTLRPSTSFTLERLAHGEGAESVWLRLLKGGVRVVTGLAGKRNPAGFELRTPTATIGIRGTRFDARLCGADCRAEGAALAAATPAAATAPLPVAARVVQLTGQVNVLDPAGISRSLAVGGALFEGEEIRTAADSTVVLGFRDQSVLSVNPSTVMRITAFSYGQPQKKDGATIGLLRGSLRALTGLIGRQSPESVKIRTLASTIGIRGTGMDISCGGPCIDPQLGEPLPPAAEPGPEPQPRDGLFMRTWQGTPFFERGPLDVPLDRVGRIGADGLPTILQTVPGFMERLPAPRPDTVPVNWDSLFAAVDPAGADGLYVYNHEGHVFVRSGDSVVDIGPGEGAWSGREGEARRISPVPVFLTLDPTPLPWSFAGGGPFLSLFGSSTRGAGQDICRL